MSDIIRLNNIRIKGNHGYYQAERDLGQTFEVDVEIFLDLEPSLRSDNLEDSVDFEEVYRQVVAEFSGNKSWLIESVAGKIVKNILKKYPIAEKVTVRIRKPQIPLDGILDNAEIEITRSRT